MISTHLWRSLFAILAAPLVGTSFLGISNPETPARVENQAALEIKVPREFNFVAFGDTRFHDPSDTEAANAAARQALIAAIDRRHPSLVSIGGDIVYVGDNVKDWEVWDRETKSWREHDIPVYPAIGNHDLKGDKKIAMSNYFARFPQLEQSRFYSLRMNNCVLLVLDSSLGETNGAQGDWLRAQFDSLPIDVDFVFLVLHHPLYTSSSAENLMGGGHSVRWAEQSLAKMLEARQQHMRARIIVFSGHVHNYERHEHNGVTYFVTGGGGAHAYPVPRAAGDLYKDPGINYHYLLVEVRGSQVQVIMNKVEFIGKREVWSEPDSVTVTAPALVPGEHAE